MTTFVAMGDSITVGMGDPTPEGRGWRGFAVLLADTLPQPDLHNLAFLGAQAADVERAQLPAALDLKPDVVSLVVGINDTLRGDFNPERTGASVGRSVAALREAGAAGADDDPARPRADVRFAEGPGPAAGPADARGEPGHRRGVAPLRRAAHGRSRRPGPYDRRYWSVDRLHPNERGHRLMACRFHHLLAEAGYPVGLGPDPEPSSPPPTRLAEFAWMATKGTAWVIRRSKDLVPALIYLAVCEVMRKRDDLDADEAVELADGTLADRTGELELLPATGIPAT